MGVTWLGFSRTYFAVVRTEPATPHPRRVDGRMNGAAGRSAHACFTSGENSGCIAHSPALGVYLLMPAIVACGFLMDKRMMKIDFADIATTSLRSGCRPMDSVHPAPLRPMTHSWGDAQSPGRALRRVALRSITTRSSDCSFSAKAHTPRRIAHARGRGSPAQPWW
jgi:hypothetical protein